MPIVVVGAEFKSKLKNLLAEADYSITDIDACIMCAKPINLQDHGNYVYDFENEVWCSGCMSLGIGEKSTIKRNGELTGDKNT